MHSVDSPDTPIIVTDADLERLLPVVDHASGAVSASLEAELQRARIVRQREVPPDVVTMNSALVYEDVETGARREVTLVYPRDADAAHGKVSVLAPIGAALLGLRLGQEIEWVTPGRRRRIRVAEVRYQPEAAGDLAL